MRAIGGCPTGGAVITPGFDLPSRFVIHAVGPIWHGGDRGEADLLRSAYERSFEVAFGESSIKSIAFPAIFTGVYGFPKDLAAHIALGVSGGAERTHCGIPTRLIIASNRGSRRNGSAHGSCASTANA